VSLINLGSFVSKVFESRIGTDVSNVAISGFSWPVILCKLISDQCIANRGAAAFQGSKVMRKSLKPVRDANKCLKIKGIFLKETLFYVKR
jgi:hypothetical protein